MLARLSHMGRNLGLGDLWRAAGATQVFDGLQVSASIESVFLPGIELVRQSNVTGRAIGLVVLASD